LCVVQNAEHSSFYRMAEEQPDAMQCAQEGMLLCVQPLDSLYVDLRPFMNRAPFTIRGDASASRAHQVFMGLGLRHLIVVDQLNHVVGMITRKDLDHAAGHGWWRVSHQAQAPQPPPAKGLKGCGPAAANLCRLCKHCSSLFTVVPHACLGFLHILMVGDVATRKQLMIQATTVAFFASQVLEQSHGGQC
jgi:CBS-domain-containing membrane protein